MRTPRFGFVTCVQLGLDVMDEIYLAGGELSVAITLDDQSATHKSGRVLLDEFASEHRLPLVKVKHINDSLAIKTIRDYALDWLFIIGWSQIASEDVLSAPSNGCIGMHPTLLPDGRGRASIPWAIIKGLPETGVTMFQLDSGVDTGPILAQERIPLDDETDAGTLYRAAAGAHRKLIRDTWAELVAGTLRPVPQDPTAGSVWPGRTPQDGRLNPDMPVESALRLIRATTHPYPGAFWETPMETVRVWRAKQVSGPTANPVFRCADGLLEAIEYTFEGRELHVS